MSMGTTHTKSSTQFLGLDAATKEILCRFLLENLPVNIFLVDRGGHVRWANGRLLNFLNAPSLGDVKGTHIQAWGDVRWNYTREVINTQQETTVEEEYSDTYFLVTRKPIIKDNKVT